MASLSSIGRGYPLTTFLVITFAFTWALLPFAAASVPVGLIALFGPALAAFVTALLAGPLEMRDLRTRLTVWRVPVRWYVVALLLPLPISALASLLEQRWGAPGPIRFQPINALSLLVFVLVVGEELGWRGFALPRLLQRFGPWSASAIIGVVWALWHLPLFHMPSMPQYGHPFVAFIGYTVALSILLTFLAQRTSGSVIIATLFHGTVNTFVFTNTAASPVMRGWGNAVSYAFAAIVIGMVAWNRSTSGGELRTRTVGGRFEGF